MTPRKSGNGKAIFAGMVFSLSGDLGEGRTQAQIENWIRHWGGKFVREVSTKDEEDGKTTHLICSIKDFKHRTPQVKRALTLGKACKIITYDYLEDCLTHRTGHRDNPRRLPERKYLLSKVIKERHKGKNSASQQKVEASQKIREAGEAFGRKTRMDDLLVLPEEDRALYHIYHDDSGFEYKTVLTRVNNQNPKERDLYTLYLFESHADCPYLYKFGAKHRVSKRPIEYHRTMGIPMEFSKAMGLFKQNFQHKVGISWEKRDELSQSCVDDWSYSSQGTCMTTESVMSSQPETVVARVKSNRK